MNKAISLNQDRKQWVDLGIHPEACITIPESCGAAGGSLTFWTKINYNDGSPRGIVSTALAAHWTTQFWIITTDYNKIR